MKVGDIIENNDLKCPYVSTVKRKGFVGEIIFINGDNINVKTIKHNDVTLIGKKYFGIHKKYFKVVNQMKVGDIIVNNDTYCSYNFTTKKQGFIGEITKVGDRYIYAKVISHKDPKHIGKIFRDLNKIHFRLATSNDHTKIVVEDPYVYAIFNGKVGISKCLKDDEFDVEFGTKLAKARLADDKELADRLIQEKYHPVKLFDSRGVELQLDDEVSIWAKHTYLRTKIKYSKSKDCIYSDGILIEHNARSNDGKPSNKWIVYKLSKEELS